MNASASAKILLLLSVALLSAKVIASWTNTYVVTVLQDGYLFEKYMPLAKQLSNRYSTLTIDDLDRIALEIERDYSLGVNAISPADLMFGELVMSDTGLYGIIMDLFTLRASVVLADDAMLDVGPLGVGLYLSLGQFVELTLMLIAALLAMYFYTRPSFRRIQMLIGLESLDRNQPQPAGALPLVERLAQNYRSVKAEVVKLNRENDRRMEEQREFLHGVAHEFRGPLARLQFAACLEDDAVDPTIEEIINEMERLVSEILQYSRYHNGMFQLDYLSLTPGNLIREAISKIQPLPAHIEVIVDDGLDQLPAVFVDELLYQRCLLNLLRNAIRFTQTRIEISGEIRKGIFIVYVDDDGPGIPPRKTQLIFEPFTRLDPSRSRESGGVGLGLAIVDGIIRRFGGTAKADRSRLGGARISIAIPADKPV